MHYETHTGHGDLYFEVIHPDDIAYTYEIMLAKNFGKKFVR